METTVAAPVSPQAPNISNSKTQSPKRHYMRTFSNSNLNNQSPRHQGYKRDGRNHRPNHYHHHYQNYKGHHYRSENNQNSNSGGKSEGTRQVNNSQAPNGWWRRTHEQIAAENKRKVIVTGYPTYTNIQEIVKLLTRFGPVKVDRCNKIVTVLVYQTEEEAQKAVSASDQIVVYGQFIKINKFTCEKHVDDMSKSAKRTKSTIQDDIILPQEIDLTGDFYQQLDNIQAAIRLTAEEIKVISTLYSDVEAVLQPIYPGCRAIPFGSITTGLGIKTSDADCFVEMPGRFLSAGHDVRFVTAARRVLAARADLFAEVVSIPGANTPIVKFRHVPTGTRCDLNCKTPLGALNSRLIAALLGHDPRLSPLALLLKYWARVHRLSGTGRLTNYTLVLLLVFYLQARRVLPPVAALQSARSQRPVDHWDAGFDSAALLAPHDDSPLPHLLGGFFNFYAEFQFDTLVVCPYLGVAVPKAAFEEGGAPPGLERYKNNVARGLAGPLRHGSALCVQDPIEQSHNVATGVTANLAVELLDHIRHAAARYQATLPTCAGLLPGVLLSAPPRRLKPNNVVRVRIAPRTVRALQGDWRSLLRRLLLDCVFADMLALPLSLVPGGVSPATDSNPDAHTPEGNADTGSGIKTESTLKSVEISVSKVKRNTETETSPTETGALDASRTETTVNSEMKSSAKTEPEPEAEAGSVTENTFETGAGSASGTETVTEKATSCPAVTSEPKAASVPAATSAPKVESVPATTSEPKVESVPAATSEPKVVSVPATTSEPKVELVPAATSEPKVVSVPATTSEPKVELVPAATSEPKVVSVPASTSEPKVESFPAATSEPKVVSVPATTSEPKVESVPAATSEPKVVSVPATTSEPKAVSGSAATSEPKADSDPAASSEAKSTSGPVATPEPKAGLELAATSELKAGSCLGATSEANTSLNPAATSELKASSGLVSTSEAKSASVPVGTSEAKVDSGKKTNLDGKAQPAAEVASESTTDTKAKAAKASPNRKGKKAASEGDKDKKSQDLEVYTCVATRVTWERRRACEPHREQPGELLARERAAAARLAAGGPELPEPLRLVVELMMTEEPRAAVLVARPLAGDAAGFRTLATFLHSWLHSWLVVLLRPHMAPPPPSAD